MAIQTTPITLVSAHKLTPNINHFVFSCEDESINQFTPGQFITLHIKEGEKTLRRSYSIANRQNAKQIEFAASYVENGPASELLFNLAIGESVEATGPFGRLVLKEEPVKRYFLVATSTGVTPYRSMLNQLARRFEANPQLEAHILLGVKDASEALYQDEFLEFSRHHPNNMQFHLCYSRETANKELARHEHHGYVQKQLMALKPNPETDIIYLCGNPQMVDDCQHALTNENFNIKQIRREKYISR